MGILSGSLNAATNNQLRKTPEGKLAIDSEDDPLTFINLLMRTDFRKGPTNSISPRIQTRNERKLGRQEKRSYSKRESLGWIYYSKLSAKFNELRSRVEKNLLKPIPKSVEDCDAARFWDTNTVEYCGAGASANAASSKGTYASTNESGGNNRSKYRCRTHTVAPMSINGMMMCARL